MQKENTMAESRIQNIIEPYGKKWGGGGGVKNNRNHVSCLLVTCHCGITMRIVRI